MSRSNNSDSESEGSDTRELLIVYATETGNARGAADFIARQCRRIAFQCRVLNVESISLPDLLSESIVLFVVSTTGSGVEPRAMTPLWNTLLRSDLPSDALEELLFSVFGLGDSGYEKFCWAAKKLSRRMISLGATEFYGRGEGDDQHPLGIDGALRPWSEGLLNRVLETFPLPPHIEVTPATEVPPPRVLLSPVPQKMVEIKDPFETDILYHQGVVRVNERITAKGWYQDVRHIEIEFEQEIQYDPGDVVVIHPYASADEVDSFLNLQDWDDIADDSFNVERNMFDQSLPDHLPTTTTLRTIFTRFLDFNAVPRRDFFEFLQCFTSDSLEREKLDELLSPEGADELYEYCYQVHRTISEVLSEFRHVKIPRDYIFDVFPPLRPREFSIASSIQRHPREVHLCVAIVKYRTKLRTPRRGVCTSYISTLKPGDLLQIGIKKGLIKLPTKTDIPIICVGPGTGVAPMRAVIEHRIESGAHSNMLYFGCRSSSKDHHYFSEWQKYSLHQQLHYRVAFSRDKPGEKKIYVQDLIEEDAEQVWNIVGVQKGWVFISGSSNKMPASVKAAIAHAVEVHGGYTAAKATKYVDAMSQEGRLIEECWS